MNELQVISLFAGKRPDGQTVVEQIRVVALDEPEMNQAPDTPELQQAHTKPPKGRYRLVQSPAFIQGLASGDEIRYDKKDNSFELIKHSGNVCIRVFAKESLEKLEENIRSKLEKLGGELDFSNDRMLVFSIHVSCGFTEIEKILNKEIHDGTQAAWFYGNVYDPNDGTTPLNWWHELDDKV